MLFIQQRPRGPWNRGCSFDGDILDDAEAAEQKGRGKGEAETLRSQLGARLFVEAAGRMAIHEHLACRRLLEQAGEAEDRALSAAIRTAQDVQPARGESRGDAVDTGAVGTSAGDTAQFKRTGGGEAQG